MIEAYGIGEAPLHTDVVVVSPEGQIKFAGQRAEVWLRIFFCKAEVPGRLPPRLCRWLAKQALQPGGESLTAKRKARRLFVKLLRGLPQDSPVLLLELIDSAGGARPDRHRKFTPREHEALRCAALNKTNKQIGEMMNISPRTAETHLQNAFIKLGVENRRAAESQMMLSEADSEDTALYG